MIERLTCFHGQRLQVDGRDVSEQCGVQAGCFRGDGFLGASVGDYFVKMFCVQVYAMWFLSATDEGKDEFVASSNFPQEMEKG